MAEKTYPKLNVKTQKPGDTASYNNKNVIIRKMNQTGPKNWDIEYDNLEETKDDSPGFFSQAINAIGSLFSSESDTVKSNPALKTEDKATWAKNRMTFDKPKEKIVPLDSDEYSPGSSEGRMQVPPKLERMVNAKSTEQFYKEAGPLKTSTKIDTYKFPYSGDKNWPIEKVQAEREKAFQAEGYDEGITKYPKNFYQGYYKGVGPAPAYDMYNRAIDPKTNYIQKEGTFPAPKKKVSRIMGASIDSSMLEHANPEQTLMIEKGKENDPLIRDHELYHNLQTKTDSPSKNSNLRAYDPSNVGLDEEYFMRPIEIEARLRAANVEYYKKYGKPPTTPKELEQTRKEFYRIMPDTENRDKENVEPATKQAKKNIQLHNEMIKELHPKIVQNKTKNNDFIKSVLNGKQSLQG